MTWAIVAIAFGIVILLTRGPLLLWPEKALAMADPPLQALLATDARVRALGIVYAAMAAACLGASDTAAPELRIAIVVIGASCVLGAVWALAAPASFRNLYDRARRKLENRPIETRALGALSIAFGLLFIVLGLQAI